MNLDKTIKDLTDRLDIVHPYSAFTTRNDASRNDGINYWKGKKIISAKDWDELYEKNSLYRNTYKSTLVSRKPLQYFPDDYNSSISLDEIKDGELKEEIENWNKDYEELLVFRQNSKWGRKKCSKCLISGSLDDPIFVGIEKVFARIVSNQCNNNNSHDPITYHCNVMNIFSCPFESKQDSNNSNNNREGKDKESKYLFKREDLFALHQISFAIEQAITTFFEITKNNEIIYEVDFENDRVHEIHTKYNGVSESWGWHENVKEQLSKVKPISNIVLRDEQDIFNILTNREKLEYLLQEYENNQLDRKEQQQVCYDEKSPCVPANTYNDNSNNKNTVLDRTTTPIPSLVTVNGKKQQQEIQKRKDYSPKGENRHSKNINERSNEAEKELNNEHLKPDLKAQIKEESEESIKEQKILLKENRQNIINFLLENAESIRIEDLKTYEPIYKCYREKGNCHVCNRLTNMICINCCNYKNEMGLCTNHWQQHAINNHSQ